MATGVQVSRIGYDVDTASDKQLAFSSEWPLLPIEAEGDITISGSGAVTQDIYTHNLGYEPVFYVHRTDGDFFFPGWCWCDDTKIWFSGFTDSSINLKWKVFRRPIKTAFTAPISNTTDATQQIDGDYGILISLPGKGVESTDKRDFGIRSDVRQLMIAKSDFTTTPIGGATVTHNLGYRPMYFIFMESDSIAGDFRQVTSASDFAVSATTTQFTWRLYTPPFRNYGYILFKDTLTANG